MLQVRDTWTQPTQLGSHYMPAVQGAIASVVGNEIHLYGGCRVNGNHAGSPTLD